MAVRILGTEITAYRVYRVAATLISLVILATFTVFVFYLSFRNYDLFSWHPSFMTLGFMFLMAEAMVMLSKDNIFIFLRMSHKQAVQQHWILQVASAACITIGLVTIIAHKNEEHHEHFHTWHAVTGIIAVVLCGITCCQGLPTLYSSRLYEWIKPNKIKFIHVCFGIAAFVFAVISESFGIYTKFFTRVTNPDVQIICLMLVLLAAVVVIEGAIRTAYTRKTNWYM